MPDNRITKEVRDLILYAYGLGGNTREMARLTGIPHDDMTDALVLANHEHASAYVNQMEALKRCEPK